MICVLVGFQALVLFPFRYTNALQERDCYRMLLGVLDGFQRSSFFSSPLFYNRQASFGYYALIELLAGVFGRSEPTLIALMNGISFASAVLFVIPFYLLVEKLFGQSIAFSSCVVLAVMPVWWNLALYGHPIMPATLLFFSGLAVLALSPGENVSLAARLYSLLLFTAALTFRFDVTLLFPAVAGVLWFRTQRANTTLREILFYVIGAIVLFEVIQAMLPSVAGGPAPPSVIHILERFQNFGKLASGLQITTRTAFLIMVLAFSPVALFLGLLGTWVGVRERDLKQILFNGCIIAGNILFWLPNAPPPRHYLQMAPALAVSTSLATTWLVSRVAKREMRPALVAWCGAAIAASIVCTSLAISFRPGLPPEMQPPYLARFSLERERANESKIADELAALRGMTKPVLVLCDSTLVVARMELLTTGVRVYPHMYYMKDGTPLLFHEVVYRNIRLYMFEQSWIPKEVNFALDTLHVYPQLPVLVDPYNPKVFYRGPRERVKLVRTSAGETVSASDGDAAVGERVLN
jgi:hypothetical protein